jgi:hypothetical protein
MLMQLRDAGKRQLDDPIEKYMPELKKIKSRFSNSRPPLTFRHVASHMAGLPYEAPFDYWKTLRVRLSKIYLKVFKIYMILYIIISLPTCVTGAPIFFNNQIFPRLLPQLVCTSICKRIYSKVQVGESIYFSGKKYCRRCV